LSDKLLYVFFMPFNGFVHYGLLFSRQTTANPCDIANKNKKELLWASRQAMPTNRRAVVTGQRLDM